MVAEMQQETVAQKASDWKKKQKGEARETVVQDSGREVKRDLC